MLICTDFFQIVFSERKIGFCFCFSVFKLLIDAPKYHPDVQSFEVTDAERKEAPKVCPVCAHPQSYFELKSENY